MAHRPMAASTSALQNKQRSPSLSALRARIGTRLSRSRDRQIVDLKLPEIFQLEDDDEDDGLQTVGPDGGMAVQSFYGIVAQAQGKSKFADNLGQTVEESEDEEEETRTMRSSVSKTLVRQDPRLDNVVSDQPPISSYSRRDSSADSTPDIMTQSQILQPGGLKSRRVPRSSSATDVISQHPNVDRRTQNKTPTEMEASVATIRKGSVVETPRTLTAAESQNVDIRKTLAEIFQFDAPEELKAEYSCWYLQNVLLQGYLYVTEKHICFFAYIQKKGNGAIKTGNLSKQGKRDPRYSRFWFVLKGDVLSYYTNAADPYFPSGAVDLRRAISAEMVEEKGRDQNDSTLFTITTDYRTYRFKADSTPSAKEWVKQLQRVIFRSHNDGDSVKISVPIANIVDIDSTPVIDFADTIRIRAIDDDETFAIEEYCFTFFNQGQEARQRIASMVEIQGRKADLGERGRSSTGKPFESTKTTVSPLVIRPKNAKIDERRASGHRSKSRPRRSNFSGSDSSPIGASDSSIATSYFADQREDFSETHMSASQILSEDTAFRAPTIRNAAPPRTISDMTYVTSETVSASEASSHPSSPTTREHMLPTAADANVSGEQDSSRLQVDDEATAKSSHVLTAPLQHAINLAGRMKSQSKRMGSYLGTSPKDYITKFSGAMKGGKRHYSEAEGLAPDDRYDDPEETLDNAEHERRFHEHFALPESEKLIAVYYCWLFRVLPLYGKIYVGSSHLCFRSLLYGTRTKLNLPFHDVDNVQKESGIRWLYPGMVVVIRGHEELFFDFNDRGNRDDCVVTILRQKEQMNAIQNSMIMTEEEKMDAQVAAAQHELLLEARQHQGEESNLEALKISDAGLRASPILFDDASASILDIRPQQSLRITCLTIGSRGDVQPYVALCKGLLAEGHKPRIATHAEFEPFVTRHGIEFVAVEGDPAELMRICVEYGMFTPSFLYEANSKFRGWLDGLLVSAYEACKGSDLLIESPSAMGGIHIAEALQIPYFRAFTMPWTRTRAYPHAFAVPNKKMGGQYNYMTYFLFDNMFWKVTAGQINRWRRQVLGLKATSLEKLQPNKVPFLYNFSPLVVPPPLDFSDWVRITGYWFLDEGANWTPPTNLVAFIAKAREDKVKLVYIGFGSVVVSDSRKLTRQVVDAVLKADVRCILSKGWSDRFATHSDDGIKLPDCIFRINAAPHDWLFRQVDAVVHHGGAGTTGASLRAGIPTIIKPFFGDQFFFATRVEDLGVGMFLKKITSHALGKALWIATHDDRMKTKAAVLGEQIDREDGVGTAIKAIYRDLDYARSLIKKREEVSASPATREDRPQSSRSTMKSSSLAHESAIYDENDSNEDEEEESWTFVEPDSDVDVTASRSRALSQVSSFLPASPSTASSMVSSGGLRPLGRMNRY